MKPSPEQLAAYADGELDAASRRDCAEWLTSHPEAAAEVESWRRLAGAWESTSPTEPHLATWADTFHRIEKALPSGPPFRVRPRRSFFLLASFVGLSAAAVLMAAVSARLFFFTPPTENDSDDEPFPVAAAHEITIISMDVKDTDSLVVGLSPVDGPLDFAGFKDIELVDIKPHPEETQLPSMDKQLALPMIVPQPAPWGGR